jgi:hypothetical protein
MDSTCNYKQLLVSFNWLIGQLKSDTYPFNYPDTDLVEKLVCRIFGLLDGMTDKYLPSSQIQELKHSIHFAKIVWNKDVIAGGEYLLSLYETGGLEVLNPIHKIPIKKQQLSTIPSNKVKSPKKYQLRNVNFQITQPPK